MSLPVIFTWFLFAHRTFGGSGRDTKLTLQKQESTIELFTEICSALCTPGPGEQRFVCVFSIHESLFRNSAEEPIRDNVLMHFLWKFPDSHVYFAKGIFPLKPLDRLIVISKKDKEGAHFDLIWNDEFVSSCGLPSCKAGRNIQRMRLERSVLIQIRSWHSDYCDEDDKRRILTAMSQNLFSFNYFRRYRASFFILKEAGSDTLWLAAVVGRSKRAASEQFVGMTMKKLKATDARGVFGSPRNSFNQTLDVALDGWSLHVAARGPQRDKIVFEPCSQVSIFH